MSDTGRARRFHVSVLLALVAYSLAAWIAYGAEAGFVRSLAIGLTGANYLGFFVLVVAPRAGARLFWLTSLFWWPCGLLGMYGAARLVEEHRESGWWKHGRSPESEGEVLKYFTLPRIQKRTYQVSLLSLALGVIYLVLGQGFASVPLGGGIMGLFQNSFGRRHAPVELQGRYLLLHKGLFRARHLVPYDAIERVEVTRGTLRIHCGRDFPLDVRLETLAGGDDLAKAIEDRLVPKVAEVA